MLLYGKNYGITARAGRGRAAGQRAEGLRAAPGEVDFNWAADNRERILDEWNKRYNAKSEAKGSGTPWWPGRRFLNNGLAEIRGSAAVAAIRSASLRMTSGSFLDLRHVATSA